MYFGRRTRILTLAALLNIGIAPFPAHAQLVYFGVADQWQDLVHHPDDWSYVRQHADGFYLNFVMLNRVIRHTAGLSEATLADTCRLFTSHSAYLESDIRSPVDGKQGSGAGGSGDGASAEQEQQYIQMLHKAGCKIAFTSLNYGWSRERARNLTQFDLTNAEGRRLNFIQTGPWALNGDIDTPSHRNHPGRNELLREHIKASDGISTDGPLGYWVTDFGHYHSANISLVRFAHRYNKKAMIMIAPYGAGQSQVYDAKRDLLGAGQQLVRFHESQHAIPDIWSVFEYATDIPAVPEQIDGKPANTMSGLAYWLIHHIHDPSHWAHLDFVPSSGTATKTVSLTLANDSSWLDVTPLLRLRIHDAPDIATKLILDGKDVTTEATSADGLALTDTMTLWPGTQRHLTLTVARAGTPVAVTMTLRDRTKPAPEQPGLELLLSPNPGVPDEVHQRFFIPLAHTS